MSDFAFTRATKLQAKARVLFSGPAGSGKTYSALRVASTLSEHVAYIDTEHGSASKYADEFTFDVLELDDFHPQQYIAAIQAAERAGYDTLVIDSITHEWSGKNGCLELLDLFAKQSKSQNKYVAWEKVTPLHNAFIEAIHAAKIHIIATVRSKMDYLQVEEGGKKAIQKVGMAPITREGMEYEFDILGELDLQHDCVITKSRARPLADRIFHQPGPDMARLIRDWLDNGAPGKPEAEPSSSTTAALSEIPMPPAETPAPPAPSDSKTPMANDTAPPDNPPNSSSTSSKRSSSTAKDSDVKIKEKRTLFGLNQRAEDAGFAHAELAKLVSAVRQGRTTKDWSQADFQRVNRLLEAMLRCQPPHESSEIIEKVWKTAKGSTKWSGPEYDYVLAMLQRTAEGAAAAQSKEVPA